MFIVPGTTQEQLDGRDAEGGLGGTWNFYILLGAPPSPHLHVSPSQALSVWGFYRLLFIGMGD